MSTPASQTELQIHPRVAQWTVQAMARLLGTFAVVHGVMVIYGGRKRWSSPLYEVAVSVPYAPLSWGLPLTLAGLLVMAASLAGWRRLTSVGLFCVAVWCAFFAFSFFTAAMSYDNLPFSVALTYGTFAVGGIVLSIAHRVRRL